MRIKEQKDINKEPHRFRMEQNNTGGFNIYIDDELMHGVIDVKVEASADSLVKAKVTLTISPEFELDLPADITVIKLNTAQVTYTGKMVH